MRIRPVAFLLLVLTLSGAIPGSVDGQEKSVPVEQVGKLVISGEKQVSPYKLARFSVSGVPAGHTILWDVYPIENVDVASRTLKSSYEFVAPPGKYKVRVRAFKGDSSEYEAWSEVLVGQAPTPSPNPQPDPPNPAPKGFRVIFVYETSQAITPAMQQVMFGEKVTSYLDTKTVKSGSGNSGWRRFDKDVKIDNEKDENIKALWNAARPQVTLIPSIIIAVDGKADIVPFPTSEDEAVTLFKKYGGN